jgi:hypothetical protein
VFAFIRTPWLRFQARRRPASPPPPDKIARAKIVGTVVPFDETSLVTAPFSLEPSVLVSSRLLEKRMVTDERGNDRMAWVHLFHEENGAPFFLVGADGARVLVHPRGGELLLPEADLAEHPHVNDENPRFAEYMRKQGVRTTRYMGIAGDHKFFERAVRPGDRIAVDGWVDETSLRGGGGYRDSMQSVPRMQVTPNEPLFVLAT